MRISDWSSDVCSSDLNLAQRGTDLFNDVRGNAGETIDGITDAARDEFAKGDVVEGTFPVVGSLLDGRIETMGDAASGLIGFGVGPVQNPAHPAANLLPHLREEVGPEPPFDPLAGFVQGRGNPVDARAAGPRP